jgi:hypothetical protein
MIERIRGNRLLLTLAAVYAAYALFAYLTPRPYMSSAVGIMALLAGAAMFFRYAGKAWDILWRQERGQYGAHNAVLGATEFSLGIIYSGIFRLLWNYFDQPDSWTGTGLSALGLFMIAKGVWRMAISPTEDALVTRFPDGFWVFVIWVFGWIVAFVVGTHFGT